MREMTVFEKLLRRIVFKRLCAKGMHPYMAGDLRDDFLNELLRNPEHLSLKRRRWAWKHGFLAQKLNNYNLTEENCGDYLSDFDYYMLYPLNNRFSLWIDDKLTLRYVLERFKQYLPKYYFAADMEGRLQCLPDYASDSSRADASQVAALLRENGLLAAKRNQGSGGDGFYRMEYSDGVYTVNGKQMDEAAFLPFVRSLRGYLITEFVVQCERYMQICPSATHTLRVQTARADDGEIRVLFSFIRWGMDAEDFCVAHSTAGVNAAVDVSRGEVHSGYYLDREHIYHNNLTRHPVSGAELTGKIPYWEEIVRTCTSIHRYLSELSYIGFDVVVTDNGFRVIEINSHSGIRTYQHVYPMLTDERCGAYFRAKLEEKKR